VKILFVSAEVYPYAKVGGLADVAGSLPKELAKLGHDIRVVMPKYKQVEDKLKEPEIVVDSLKINMGSIGTMKANICKTMLEKNVPIYFIENNQYFYRDKIYSTNEGDYPDNPYRFTFFSRAILKMLEKLEWLPDIIHCNDYHTALIPVLLKTEFKDSPLYKKIATIFTIHNLSYQGIFSKVILDKVGLDKSLYSIDKMEYWGKINFMKGGIIFSEKISTVSPTYSREILTPEYGNGLDGVLRTREKDIVGIINGIDYEEWNPETDPFIKKNYSKNSLKKKLKCKKDLMIDQELKTSHLEIKAPLIGIISRLADQKGLDLVEKALEKIINLGAKLIILGTGDAHYHEVFQKMSYRFKENFRVNLKFDSKLAHKIYSGCDMFLMPSKFEPCGLGQLISFKYGTIPIVRRTGGLADTVIDCDEHIETGTGFVFKEQSVKNMISAIERAIFAYKDKRRWNRIVKRVMEQDFSWENSAKEYVKLYNKNVLSK
jgi:starch synthase